MSEMHPVEREMLLHSWVEHVLSCDEPLTRPVESRGEAAVFFVLVI